ncbi:NACHT domain-containing protein [Streptomyces phyllanthi]|uniref:NACHT domain-containing protein n=1 Tax=Streptomyces phyllanthi TaxID=1803180 RepID=UPI00128C95C0|nr:helix-turn-helix domain-containing protein [Streptomyces phyllanthi]
MTEQTGPQEQLAGRLRELRVKRRLTMAGLATKSAIGRTTVSQVLNGRIPPSEAVLVALAQALKADPAEFEELRSLQAAVMSRQGPGSPDSDFEERYRRYVVDRYGTLTIVGLDLRHSDQSWPLDAAYLSLELADMSETAPLRGFSQPEGMPFTSHDVRVVRAEQALSGRERTLVRGLAGSGKTTLLQWLAVTTAQGLPATGLEHLARRIPYVLPMRTLVRRGSLPSPQAFLDAMSCPFAEAQPRQWTDGVLQSGRGLLLIDGMDEVPADQRRAARSWLQGLLSAYPRSCFVVTTRPSAVPEGWLSADSFVELTIRPMRGRDTDVFITRWHEAAAGEASGDQSLAGLREKMRDAIRAKRELAQLATTPLMCALMCALHRDRRGHLPQGRMELYEAALSTLLDRRDNERGIETPEGVHLSERQSIQLLQRLAYWMVVNRQTEMHKDFALRSIGVQLPAMPSLHGRTNAEKVLAHLINRSGVLRQPTEDTIDFVHRTFQDYLGAKACVEAGDFPLLLDNAHDDQWEDVIRMAVSHARPNERVMILKELIARGNEARTQAKRLHLLAMACLEYATEVHPDVQALVEQNVAGLLPPRSYRDARVLGQLGPVILDLLPGPENLAPYEAEAVVTTAAIVGGPPAFVLLKRFRNHPSPAVQRALADSWSAFDAQDYADEIIEHLPDRTLVLAVDSAAQFDMAEKLGRDCHVRISRYLPLDGIARLPRRNSVVAITVSGDEGLAPLDLLSEFPRLHTLKISGAAISDWTPLQGTTVRNLTLSKLDNCRLGSLRHLDRIEKVTLGVPRSYHNLLSLRVPANITELRLSGIGSRKDFLVGVSRLRRLSALSVEVAEPSAKEFAHIAALSRLKQLQLTGLKLRALSNVPPLPNVEHLILHVPRGTPAAADLRRVFPGLRTISIFAEHRPVDVRRLADWPGLRVRVHNASSVRGADRFTPEVLTLIPEPREDVLSPLSA